MSNSARQTSLRTLVLLPLILALTSCGLPGAGVGERQTRTFPAGNAPMVVVMSDGGSISLSTGADNTVQIEAVKRAPTSSDLAQMQVLMTSANGDIRAAYQAAGEHGRRSVDFSIRAPKSSHLRLETGGGSIEASGFSGDISTRTGGGSITIKNQTGALQAQSGGGSLDISGRLTGESSITSGGGSITVSIPRDSNLRVSASSAGGSVSNDFGLPVQGLGGQRVDGTIGDGSQGSLTIRTEGGSIGLRQR